MPTVDSLIDVLERLRLRGSISELLRFDAERWGGLERDLRATREQLDPVVRNLPRGDKIAWILTSLDTPYGWKMDGVMSLVARLAGFTPMAAYAHQDLWAERFHAAFGLDRATKGYP